MPMRKTLEDLRGPDLMSLCRWSSIGDRCSSPYEPTRDTARGTFSPENIPLTKVLADETLSQTEIATECKVANFISCLGSSLEELAYEDDGGTTG